MNDNSNLFSALTILSESLNKSFSGKKFEGLNSAINSMKIALNSSDLNNVLALESLTVFNQEIFKSFKTLNLDSVDISKHCKDIFDNIDFSQISFDKNVNYEECIEIIIDDLNNNQPPTDIAINLEKKTNIDYKYWLETILTIISILCTIYFGLQPQQEQNIINNANINVYNNCNIDNSNNNENNIDEVTDSDNPKIID